MKTVQIKKLDKKKVTKKWIDWINDPSTNIYSERQYIKHTIISQKKWFDLQRKTGNLIFGIYYRNSWVGIIDIKLISKIHKNCEIGYFIGSKKNWGKGIASKAIKLIVLYVKNKLKLKKIIAHTYGNNTPSKKALTKNKFKKEGEIKNFYTFEKKRISKIYYGKNL